jgi:hypothetical protein
VYSISCYFIDCSISKEMESDDNESLDEDNQEDDVSDGESFASVDDLDGEFSTYHLPHVCNAKTIIF